jgi:3-oxoacyl-[acyl-carrier protein] reductase
MNDLYSQIVNLPVAGQLASRVGLPKPVELERGSDEITGPVLLGGAGRTLPEVARVLKAMNAETVTALDDPVRAAAAGARLDAAVLNEQQQFKALVFDATAIATSAELVELQRFFYPVLRRLLPSGRVLVIGSLPNSVAQRALEGFTRSLAKEVGRGATVQLVQVETGAEDQLESTLRFLLTPRSAYVDAQVVRVTRSDRHPVINWSHPLGGKVALVTGASRGIGKSIAEVLARQGAEVVGLDIPGTGMELEVDITSPEAPDPIARRFKDGLDVVVHNAGVTKDRTLAKMPEDRWQSLMEVNLIAPERITEALLPVLNDDARIVCVSSMSGIAGNAGQTNYATSKAGVIGLVQTLAPTLERGITINAVAPGFIETQMTAAMPIGVREAGRRMNSLRQGGLPVDVAETIAWFASPGSAGVNGNVVRVCGQSLLGA